MGPVPHPVCAGFFKDIIEGKMALKKLPEACTRAGRPPHLQRYILEVAKHARPDKHIRDWDMLAKVFPALCSQKFIDGWVTSIKVKHEKISDAPPPSRKPSKLSVRTGRYTHVFGRREDCRLEFEVSVSRLFKFK